MVQQAGQLPTSVCDVCIVPGLRGVQVAQGVILPGGGLHWQISVSNASHTKAAATAHRHLCTLCGCKTRGESCKLGNLKLCVWEGWEYHDAVSEHLKQEKCCYANALARDGTTLMHCRQELSLWCFLNLCRRSTLPNWQTLPMSLMVLVQKMKYSNKELILLKVGMGGSTVALEVSANLQNLCECWEFYFCISSISGIEMGPVTGDHKFMVERLPPAGECWQSGKGAQLCSFHSTLHMPSYRLRG